MEPAGKDSEQKVQLEGKAGAGRGERTLEERREKKKLEIQEKEWGQHISVEPG